MAEDGGAAWLAAQAHEELRIAGGRRRRQRQEPTRLTPQEERVAALAATGATTKQIADQLYLSTSTIETHLEHIYAKLGIHSRRELMSTWPASPRKE
jgi:DNA-binding NarL/FixJ family response regulator